MLKDGTASVTKVTKSRRIFCYKLTLMILSSPLSLLNSSHNLLRSHARLLEGRAEAGLQKRPTNCDLSFCSIQTKVVILPFIVLDQQQFFGPWCCPCLTLARRFLLLPLVVIVVVDGVLLLLLLLLLQVSRLTRSWRSWGGRCRRSRCAPACSCSCREERRVQDMFLFGNKNHGLSKLTPG